MTTYKNSAGYLGRAWITWDGEEILNFSNQDTWNQYRSYSHEQTQTGYITHDTIKLEERTENSLMEKGEFSKYDFANNAFDFLNLNVQDALKSDNPILRALAVVDKRIGKRSLTDLKKIESHPMILHLMQLRME